MCLPFPFTVPVLLVGTTIPIGMCSIPSISRLREKREIYEFGHLKKTPSVQGRKKNSGKKNPAAMLFSWEEDIWPPSPLGGEGAGGSGPLSWISKMKGENISMSISKGKTGRKYRRNRQENFSLKMNSNAEVFLEQDSDHHRNVFDVPLDQKQSP